MKTTLQALVALMSVPALFGADRNDLPSAAKQLEKEYERDVRSATDPLTARYVKNLQELCDRRTKQGDLDGAVDIRRLMVSARISPFVGTWTFANGRFEIKKDCSAVYLNNGTKGKCEIQDDQVVILWQNDWKYSFRFDQTGDKIRMKEISPENRSNLFDATRDK